MKNGWESMVLYSLNGRVTLTQQSGYCHVLTIDYDVRRRVACWGGSKIVWCCGASTADVGIYHLVLANSWMGGTWYANVNTVYQNIESCLCLSADFVFFRQKWHCVLFLAWNLLVVFLTWNWCRNAFDGWAQGRNGGFLKPYCDMPYKP